MQDVCAKCETPQSLVCNEHPFMLVECLMMNTYQQIHDIMGGNTLNECFLIDTDF